LPDTSSAALDLASIARARGTGGTSNSRDGGIRESY
jgi:hypothetical protein